LQDRCSNVPFSAIYEVLEKEFPTSLDTLFSSIEETPLAAASLAQVHRARLVDGSEVVIKVLRPGSRKMVEEDMTLLESIAQLVEQYFSDLGYSPTSVAKEFSRELLKELNMVNEGQATDRLRRYFEHDTTVYFPRVYWQATTRNILTLEEIKGRLLSTLHPDDLSREERRAIVARGTDAVFAQCLQYGFFHADPHPGNIILQENSSICFIDCGLTGQLDRQTTEHLIDLVAGVIQGNIDKLCRVVIELTDVDPVVTDRRDFRTDVKHLSSHFKSADLAHLDIATLLSEFFSMLQRYKIRCPGDLILLTKALTTIEGVAEQFDPTFDVLSHVEPRIQKIVMSRYGFFAMKDRMQKTLTNYLELFEEMPGDLQRFLGQFRHSRFTLNLEMKRIEHLAEKIDLSSRIMGMAMIIAALIVGSSILILADRMSDKPGFLGTLGIIGLILAGINSAGFIASFLLPRKRK
jgi:ubiquinone biosynthesis protein